MQDRPIHQSLHPSLLPILDPEYIAFHNKYMRYIPRDESSIWDGSARYTPSLPPGGSPVVDVGETIDVEVGEEEERFGVRVYLPARREKEAGGLRDEGVDGLPVFVWFHGGGWAIGGVEDSKDFLTRVCRDNRCAVITVSYRLSPEHPYPAPILDALKTLDWIYSQPLQSRSMHFDTKRISIGGTSAGANLAIVLALKVAENPGRFPHLLKALVGIVPVVDNTAMNPFEDEEYEEGREEEIRRGEKGFWHVNRHAPWLTPTRMLWYRNMYMPNPADWRNWDASPNLAPEELLRKLPPVWFAVSECDLLAPEAMAFAEKVEDLGVHAERYVVKGGTHSILALNGVLERGREMVEEAVRVVGRGMRS
ncbi:Alpha/Beta hydrolase protein [Clohesyomyces aquaticus]|uniref:Alpha/Beta hydrolase protein n=1 Tax=Clohesyomyces aquaticus TaxID=1231657 RepID=A0A1Y1Y9Y5_9PLEO|nr:Alpha/Beta hydrolase protein [Clohesyomyces aquaticus]